MSAITKEHLIESLQHKISVSSVFPESEKAQIDLEIARIALASLEAKSRKLFTCSGCGAEGLDEPLESKCHCNEDGAHWVESVAYTAPPAPVSVPDAIPKLKDGRGFKYVKDGVCYSVNYANGWNQCRAAMLHGAEPVSQTYNLPELIVSVV